MSEKEPSPGDSVRALMRRADKATLATVQRDGDGWPYASLALIACDHGAAPLIFVSDLADHTKNIKEDARVSLLYDGTAGLEDPLTGARASVQGRAEPVDDERLLDRYVRRHPSAEMYKSFTDFQLYRIAVERAHLVAGFGRILWMPAAKFMATSAPALVEAEADIVAHMNEDHADALDLYAGKLLGLAGTGWRMTGCDGEGADLRLGGTVARVDFTRVVDDAEGARAELVRLVKRARDE